jgi:hypothetical protein
MTTAAWAVYVCFTLENTEQYPQDTSVRGISYCKDIAAKSAFQFVRDILQTAAHVAASTRARMHCVVEKGLKSNGENY